MYLILIEYIQLQLKYAVPAHVRDALEPGVFSVITVTPDGMRQILNASMDASGRAVWREMYQRWLKIGKWKGV